MKPYCVLHLIMPLNCLLRSLLIMPLFCWKFTSMPYTLYMFITPYFQLQGLATIITTTFTITFTTITIVILITAATINCIPKSTSVSSLPSVHFSVSSLFAGGTKPHCSFMFADKPLASYSSFGEKVCLWASHANSRLLNCKCFLFHVFDIVSETIS